MSFTTTAYYRNFSVIPEPMRTPVPLEGLTQVAIASDLADSNATLTAAQLMGGSIYMAPTADRTLVLPSGDDMMKTFGKNLDKYINTGSIVRVEVVNYGTADIIINSGVGGVVGDGKTFENGIAGSGTCGCLNIKFTSATGSYVLF